MTKKTPTKKTQKQTTFQTTSTVFVGPCKPRSTENHEEWQLWYWDDAYNEWLTDESYFNENDAYEYARQNASNGTPCIVIHISLPKIRY